MYSSQFWRLEVQDQGASRAGVCISWAQQYKQALQELVRCVALTRICYGDSHWKLAEAHVNLAQGYLQLKGLSLQAKQHAEKAKEILTNAIVRPYNDNTDVFKCSVELFHTMGRALLSLQKFKEASENLTKAERLSKELLQCGRIIKEEWIEIQTQIKLSFAQRSFCMVLCRWLLHGHCPEVKEEDDSHVRAATTKA
ncbi:Tetratricopeptide repeat protein 23, partial [Eschrichtius robustus]|nr:Tetratricopeptide repeat protein 23 [Eschrichtius robustus]